MAARSVMMSPNMLVVTITSNHSGFLTIHIHVASTWPVVDLDFRIFLRHLMEGALPEIEYIGQHIGLAAERQLAGLAGSNVFFGKPAPRILPGMTFFRKLKRKFQAAVNLCTGIDHFLNRDFIRRPFSGNAAHAVYTSPEFSRTTT